MKLYYTCCPPYIYVVRAESVEHAGRLLLADPPAWVEFNPATDDPEETWYANPDAWKEMPPAEGEPGLVASLRDD